MNQRDRVRIRELHGDFVAMPCILVDLIINARHGEEVSMQTKINYMQRDLGVRHRMGNRCEGHRLSYVPCSDEGLLTPEPRTLYVCMYVCE